MAPGGGNSTEKAVVCSTSVWSRTVPSSWGDVGFTGQILGFIAQTLEGLMVWSVPQRDHSGVRGWRAMGDRPGGPPELMTQVWVDVWPFQEGAGLRKRSGLEER